MDNRLHAHNCMEWDVMKINYAFIINWTVIHNPAIRITWSSYCTQTCIFINSYKSVILHVWFKLLGYQATQIYRYLGTYVRTQLFCYHRNGYHTLLYHKPDSGCYLYGRDCPISRQNHRLSISHDWCHLRTHM